MNTRRGFSKIPLLLTLFVALGLIAASCGANDTTTAANSATETDTEEAAANSEETGSEETSAGLTVAPSVVLPTVSGGQVDFGSLEGTDTILWYWAPW